MKNVSKEIKKLKRNLKVKLVLRDPEVISYLNILQEQYVMCPVDKAANNIAFVCKKQLMFINYYIKQFSTSE